MRRPASSTSPVGYGVGNGAVGLGHLEGGDGPFLVRDLLDLVQAHQADEDE